jgi:multicomponent Na+:H+ antiporter subunit D
VTQLPALQIVIPLIAAPLCVLFSHHRVAWAIATLATWLSLLVSLGLFLHLPTHEYTSYFMGGWEAPIGIEYRVDIFSALMLVLVSGIASVMLPYAMHSVEKDIAKHKISLFYAVYLLCFCGLQGIVITHDAFNLYVFLEISSLATYTLIGLGKDRRALFAAFQYLILGTIGATFILIGIGLLYQMTGTLNISDIAARIDTLENTQPVRTAFAFFIIGLCLKLALFPLHMWLPNAYSFAPSFVSAFLAATATKVSVYALLRVLLTLFGIDFSYIDMPLAPILTLLALLAIIMASLSALFQSNVKTLLAFSSIAQTGYIALAISLGTAAGFSAAIIHIINHAIIKGALFLALGAVTYRLGHATFLEIQGLSKSMPWTALALALGGISLIGVPLTAGFISKWYLLHALIEQGAWFRLAVVVVGSILALMYVWRIIEAMYFFPASAKTTCVTEAPPSLLIPLWVLIGLSIYFGFNTEYSAAIAQQAAAWLMQSHSLAVPLEP